MAGDREDTGEVSERWLFAAPAELLFRNAPAPRDGTAVRKPRVEPRATADPRAFLPQRPIPVRWNARSALRALALEYDRGTAFLFLPVFLAAGVVTYFALPAEPGIASLAGLAVPPLAAAVLLRHRPAAYLVAVALLLAALGALIGKVETMRAGTRMLGSAIATQITGTAATVEHMANGRVRLTIDVTGTDRPKLRYAPDRVRVTARRVPAGTIAGSTVTGRVRLMPPSGPVRPDSYDFSFESYFDGVGASGFFLSGPTLVVDAPAATSWRDAVENFRYAVADRVRDRIGGAEGEVAAALIVGVRAGIPEDLSEAMRTAGLYHVISISGLHMALVAATLMFLPRRGLALFPDFAARWPIKKASALLALAGITAYLLISGGEVAAQRSYVMLAVMLVAVICDRAALTMRNLAISAALVIVLSPHEVVGPSFQMSFAATAALVGAYGGVAEFSDRRGGTPARRSIAGWVLRYAFFALLGLAATSLIAGFSTSVYAVYHFQRISPLSLFANLAAMPIVSVIVMPMAVMAALAMPFGLDGPFLYAMGAGIGWMSAIAVWLAAHSPADSVGVIPGSAVILLTIALIFSTLGTTWLRLAAIPPAVLGVMMLGTARMPDILVSEDARLVGVAMGSSGLAVNRARPNEFTVGNWRRAVAATDLIPPVIMADGESAAEVGTNPAPAYPPAGRVPGSAAPDGTTTGQQPVQGARKTGTDGDTGQTGANTHTGQPGASAAPIGKASTKAEIPTNPKRATPHQTVGDSPEKRFVCENGLCLARHPSGIVIAHAASASALARACGQADLIVVADATARRQCATGRPRIITARDLARRGAAAVYVDRSGNGRPRLAVEMAVATPYRPWHAHRVFSREARGLPANVSPGAAVPPDDVSSGG